MGIRLKIIRFVLILGIILYPMVSFSQEDPQKPSSSLEGTRLLHYSVAFGMGYQSLLLYHRHEMGMESFLTTGLHAIYYPLSFLSISYTFGAGIFSYYNIQALNASSKLIFPTSVQRFDLENSLSLEFYGFTNSSSLMYFGIGGTYLYLGELRNTGSNSSSSSFAHSERHIFALRFSVGSRFALYDHTLMGVELYAMLPFKKTNSWSAQGPAIYKQLILGFLVNIGYFA